MSSRIVRSVAGCAVVALCALTLSYEGRISRTARAQGMEDFVDSDGDGLSDREERDRYGTDPDEPDTDGDGLLDGWEVEGLTRYGWNEPLHVFGAHPLVKDVFVEIDWMETADGDASVNALVAYRSAIDIDRLFRRSGTGIRIHFDLGSDIEQYIPPELREEDAPDFSRFRETTDAIKVVPYQDRFPTRPPCNGTSSLRSLYDVYNDGLYFRPSRRNVFYYAVIAEHHGLEPDGRSSRPGLSDNFSDENARRAGLKPAGVQVGVVYRLPRQPLPEAQLRFNCSVSLLHELGHAFGLGHGGARPDGRWNNRNHKPNYPSIMNYTFQFWGVDLRDGLPVMDFSRGRFGPILENRLLEGEGFGEVLPNPHLREIIGVRHLDTMEHPRNLDWNGNGIVDPDPVHMDLDGNDRLDTEPFRDHDDWGRFLRLGFAGIGHRAFNDCGLGCQAGEEIIRIPGDFNGDGITDLVLLSGSGLAAAFGTPSGGMLIPRDRVFRNTMDGWELSFGDQSVVVDLDDDGADEILLHRTNRAALFDLSRRGVRTLWSGSEIVPRVLKLDDGDAAPERPTGWTFGKEDRLHVLRGREGAREGILVSNHDHAALLSWQQERVVVEWFPPEPLSRMTNSEFPVVLPGRLKESGGRTFFARGSRTLVEFADQSDLFLPRQVAFDGWIPHRSDAKQGWQLSPTDCLVRVDLFGDGRDEIFIKGTDRIGVIREFPPGLFLVWAREGELGPWRIRPGDAVYTGQFLEGSGEEIVVGYRDYLEAEVRSYSWAALEWNHATAALDLTAVARNEIRDPAGEHPPWRLSGGQFVAPGRFVSGKPTLLLVQDRDAMLLARLTREGFEQVARYSGAIGSWSLGADDQLIVADADADSADEVLVKRGPILATLNLAPLPGVSFIAKYNETTFTFEAPEIFIRGDANGDESLDITDAFALLVFLFHGGKPAVCEDAADADDNGTLDLSDPIRLLNFLFLNGRPLPAPGPHVPGIDPTPDRFGCGRR